MAMKHRYSLPVLLGSYILTSPALLMAEETYLLQLGSFEKREEAAARWDSLQKKYPDLLDDLSLRVLDVTLPPDNFTVYRTQGGPVESRAEAESLCERLSTRGDECYVVETAMFSPDAEPVSSPVLAEAPELAPEPQAVEPEPEPEPESQAQPERAPEPERPVALAEPEQIRNAPLAEESLDRPVGPIERPALKPEPVAVEPVAETTPEETPADAAFAALEPQPLFAPQPETPMETLAEPAAEPLDESLPEAEEEGESFWSFLDGLNPFADDEAEPLSVEPEAPAAPAALSSALPLPPEAPAESEVNEVAEERLSRALSRGPVMTDSPFQIVRRDGGAEPPVAAADPVAQAVPLPLAQAAQADVTVAEAVRVPLSEAEPAAPAFALPSQAATGRELWAKLGYFPDAQSALAFWNDTRARLIDLPPLRVRVTEPYRQGSEPRVSLRVGPFAQARYVSNFCADAATDAIQCQPLAEMAATASERRQLANRYAARNQNVSGQEMYWVQLGSYEARAQAESIWGQLQTRHQDLLQDRRADIAEPALSSAEQAIFRLRTGPYPLKHQADALCNTLELRGDACAVVFGR